MKTVFSLLFCVFIFTNAYPQSKTAEIRGGKFVPFYGNDSGRISVPGFYMDVYPVTNEDYLKFVKKYPKWRKSKVKKIFADGNYLAQWKADTLPGKNINMKAPVTGVSWFAANDYCECQGQRLPTIDEWEYAAAADQNTADARQLKSYNQFILSWYEKPKSFNTPVGSTFKNYWGIYDLHGLVWEWTADFNSVLVSGESRKDVDNDSDQFCGSASVGASDLMNYAAFMRYALRGSVKANYALKNLGFRCIKDKK